MCDGRHQVISADSVSAWPCTPIMQCLYALHIRELNVPRAYVEIGSIYTDHNILVHGKWERCVRAAERGRNVLAEEGPMSRHVEIQTMIRERELTHSDVVLIGICLARSQVQSTSP